MTSFSKLKIVALMLSSAPAVIAESWPSLVDYVTKCVLIVEAEHVGELKHKGESITFKVTETWKGTYSPELFLHTPKEGYIEATQGAHGVNVTQVGQKIVFFYTLHNQPHPKLRDHSTAFSVIDDKLVYARTGNPGESIQFTLEEFKTKIRTISTNNKKEPNQ